MEKAKGKSCVTCKWENEKLNPCVFCININSPLASEWEQKKPKTNADRIRSMTNEELAKFVTMVHGNGLLGTGPTNGWLDWLRQEAADEN